MSLLLSSMEVYLPFLIVLGATEGIRSLSLLLSWSLFWFDLDSCRSMNLWTSVIVLDDGFVASIVVN